MPIKPGANLERLVAAIERATHVASDVQVEPRKKLRDKDTGRPREHDVVLTFTLEHHSVLLAIECRDRSRKIGVPEVEAFNKKCERTGVHRGVMVSAIGFRKTALKKAAEMEIACRTLEQVDKFDWCLIPVIEHRPRDLIDEQRPWNIATAEPFDGAFQIYDASGSVMDTDRFSQLAQTFLTMRPADLAENQDEEAIRHPVTCNFQIEMPELYLRNLQGAFVRISRLMAHVTYRITPKLVPLEFHEYVNRATGKLITSAAVAHLEGAAGEADVVIRRAEDGTLTIALVTRNSH